MSDDLTRTAHGTPPLDDGAPSLRTAPFSYVGRYRILRVVGEGGMGTVFEAEQDSPRRVVALKVIRPGFLSPQLLRRFEQESQVLGRLQHPGIAQVYEAGTADSGAGPQPYFAMELVRGRALDQYARERNLGAREILELVARVCDAVEHAHQNGIVHRDLKPGNILVDPSGQPKVLDFGVARATGSDAQATMHTEVGAIVGTLAYMSPEQVGADPAGLDTRSDVYALGVILYELLAGRLPYDVRQKTLPEAVRIIREEDPGRLTMVSRTFRGDVETIAAKALSKERERRYQSAADLAADIRRHLNDEPIVARPSSTAYQLGKFARRNKVLVGGIAAVFVVLVVGVVASSWQAVRATRAEGLATSRLAETQAARALAERRQQEAEQARAIAEERRTEAEAQRVEAERARGAETAQRLAAEAVSLFLQDMLSSVDPSAMKGRDVTVRQVLDEAAREVADGSLRGQPELEASVRTTLGETYRALGLYPEAEPHLRAALATRRKILGPDHPDVATSLNGLALVLEARGDLAGAEMLLRESLAIRRRLPREQRLDVAQSLNNLAWLLQEQGDNAGAEPLFREALRIRVAALGPDHPDVATVENNLAALLSQTGNNAAAEPLFREAIRVQRATLGPRHPDVASGLNNLADLLAERGDVPAAETLYREALSIQREALGAHPELALTLNGLARLLQLRGDMGEAASLHRESLAIRRKALGDAHPDVAQSLNNLANVLRAEGDLAGAEPLYRESLAILRGALGDDHPSVGYLLLNLARVCHDRGDLDGAESLNREALERWSQSFGEGHLNVAAAKGNLGAILVDEGQLGEAETLLRDALEVRRKQLLPRHPDVASSLVSLGLCLVRADRHADAEPLLREGLSIREEKLPPGNVARFGAQSVLGEALAGQRKFDEAEPLLLSGYAGMKDSAAATPAGKRDAAARIERLYAAWDRPDRAAAWRASSAPP